MTIGNKRVSPLIAVWLAIAQPQPLIISFSGSALVRCAVQSTIHFTGMTITLEYQVCFG